MFIRARSFFLSALVSAACLTAAGCDGDPTAGDPTAEIDPAVPHDHACPGTPVQPLAVPVDPPRESVMVGAPIAAPAIIVDAVELNPARRIVPLPRPAIDGETDAPVIVPDDDQKGEGAL